LLVAFFETAITLYFYTEVTYQHTFRDMKLGQLGDEKVQGDCAKLFEFRKQMMWREG